MNKLKNSTVKQIQEIVVRETGSLLSASAVWKIRGIMLDRKHEFNQDLLDENSRGDVTIMLTDLRGFTSIAESLPTGIVVKLLNSYLKKMIEIIVRNHGTIDKFMGDAIMVVFGLSRERRDHVNDAVRCAVEMQIAMDEVNAYNKKGEIPEMFMGIGINTGTVVAGLLGSDLHAEYTIIGDEVNLTSRIEAFSLRGQVLISEASHDRCRNCVGTNEPMDVLVKGKVKPVNIYEVVSIPSLSLEVPRRENRRSPRVEVSIPFSCRVVANKIVMPHVYRGTIRDISYQGVLSELEQKIAQHSEVKMELDLSLVGYRDANIYARVLNSRSNENRFLSGMEFTSISTNGEINIKRFVQLLIQGREIR